MERERARGRIGPEGAKSGNVLVNGA